VKEPKNFGVSGKKVVIKAPISSGTTIIPPGTFSIARLIGTCMSFPSRAPRLIDHFAQFFGLKTSAAAR
jgi:hypothetical protein